MAFQSFTGRVLGFSAVFLLSFHAAALHAAGSSASSRHAEVAIKYKKANLAEFRLADFEGELLQCSALAALHTWIGDNIGTDEGSEVRKALNEDYWLDISREYYSLAREASGDADLSQEIRAEIKSLTGEWRRLTETEVGASDWNVWYDLVDRCDTWRPETTTRSYYNKGRETLAEQVRAPEVAMKSE